MKKILVKGPALSQSGYGEHARFVLRALRSRAGLFDIYLININWGDMSWIWEDNEERKWIDSLLAKTIEYGQQRGSFDVSLQVTIPQEWEPLAPVNIGITAGTETTKISPLWVEKCMHMDRIIVVSEYTKQAFINTEYPATNTQTGEQITAKVNCPIDVIGYPVKDIQPADLNIDFKSDFNFLTMGTWIPRKNLENTIKWFVEQFYEEDVGLIIKTTTAKNSIIDRVHCESRLRELLKEYGDRKCQIYLLHGDMTEEEVTGLYQHPKVKCLVNIAHGEGFGLPLFEASYNGLPVITIPYGGQCDFLYMPIKDKKGKIKNKPMFSSVSYNVAPVQPEAVWEGVIQKDSQWAYAKEWDYKKALRTVHKNMSSPLSKAKKLQKYLQKEFSEKNRYKLMIRALGEECYFENVEYVFVSDLFKEQFVGGAELSLQALIDACKASKYTINSSKLTTDIIDENKEATWIFGNIAQMDDNLINYMAESGIKYHFIEFDYKLCEYRNPLLYEFLEDEKCDYSKTNKGLLIKKFVSNAQKVFFMSELQKSFYTETFSDISHDNMLVLSSVFDEQFFDKINSLNANGKTKNKKGWIVFGSRSWVKGPAEAERWCKDNDLDYEVIFNVEYEEMLEKLAQAEGICFKPLGLDTCPRFVIEAKLLGCKLELNENVQHVDEEWFSKDNSETISYLKERPRVFWDNIVSQ